MTAPGAAENPRFYVIVSNPCAAPVWRGDLRPDSDLGVPGC
jgi:hypothetical protein